MLRTTHLSHICCAVQTDYDYFGKMFYSFACLSIRPRWEFKKYPVIETLFLFISISFGLYL